MSILNRIKVKETMRISRKGLLKLLSENDHMQRQITELQADNTRLVLENRALKGKLSHVESGSGFRADVA